MLQRVIVIGVPVLIATGASAAAFAKERNLIALVQLIGAICLLVVILAHVAEAFNLLPAMGWGSSSSLGHYIDLASAISGVILLTVGYLSRKLLRRKTSN